MIVSVHTTWQKKAMMWCQEVGIWSRGSLHALMLQIVLFRALRSPSFSLRSGEEAAVTSAEKQAAQDGTVELEK